MARVGFMGGSVPPGGPSVQCRPGVLCARRFLMNDSTDTNKLLLVIIAILLPPVAVALKKGVGLHLVINIVLLFVTLWIGALIHALWCVLA